MVKLTEAQITALRERAERVRAVTPPSTHAHGLALGVLHLIPPVRPVIRRGSVQEQTARQRAYDAVWAMLHLEPHSYSAEENARLWRAVHAAVDALVPPQEDNEAT